jgi:HEAT repeat protein
MTGERPNREAVGADGRRQVRGVELGTAEPADYSAPDVAPVEDATVGELRSMLDAEAASRRRAILALSRRDPGTETVDRLETLARSDPDDQVRQFAVEALGKVAGDPQVALDLLHGDENPWVRAEAAVTLDRLDRTAYEETFESLLDEEAVGVRRNAMISLARIRGRDAKDVLLAGLDDPSDRVREWAVKLLGQFDDDPGVSDTLQAVLEDDSEPEVVRETAARALGARGEDVEDLLEDGTGTASADDHMLNRVPDR